MKRKQKSISITVGIIYLTLMILNISLISTIVYENQIDLITENTKFKARELTNSILNQVKQYKLDIKKKKIFAVKDKKNAISELKSLLSPLLSNYNIISENGKSAYSTQGFKTRKNDLPNCLKAVANLDFTGKQYYSHIDERNNNISFYIPLKFPQLKKHLLIYRYNLEKIDDNLNKLYILIFLVIITVSILHIIFAYALLKLIVLPIKSLHAQSLELGKGNFDVRSDIKSDNEIGQLSNAFNNMADSIQSKIRSMQSHAEVMAFELTIAQEMQNLIFPKKQEFKDFDWTVYHRPLMKVSGDYYDIFEISDSKTGFLILDAAGHGVSAALLTMVAKEKFRLKANSLDDPSQLLAEVNKEISELLEDYDTYFSAFYLVYDSTAKTVHYTNAGHQKTLHYLKQEKRLIELDTDGCLIGIMPELGDAFITSKIEVDSEDRLFLFTDGISEGVGKDNSQFGLVRLYENILSTDELSAEKAVEKIMENYYKFTPQEKVTDDITLFVVEFK